MNTQHADLVLPATPPKVQRLLLDPLARARRSLWSLDQRPSRW